MPHQESSQARKWFLESRETRWNASRGQSQRSKSTSRFDSKWSIGSQWRPTKTLENGFPMQRRRTNSTSTCSNGLFSTFVKSAPFLLVFYDNYAHLLFNTCRNRNLSVKCVLEGSPPEVILWTSHASKSVSLYLSQALSELTSASRDCLQTSAFLLFCLDLSLSTFELKPLLF